MGHCELPPHHCKPSPGFRQFDISPPSVAPDLSKLTKQSPNSCDVSEILFHLVGVHGGMGHVYGLHFPHVVESKAGAL